MSYTLHSLIASKKDAQKALTEHDKDLGVEVMTPFDVMFFVDGISVTLDKDMSRKDVERDMCFVKIPEGVEKSDVDVLEFFDEAIIGVSGEIASDTHSETEDEPKRDDHDDLFGSLEQEMRSEKLEREYTSLVHSSRVMTDSQNDSEVIIHKSYGAISKMLPEGFPDHILFFQPPTVTSYENGNVASIEPDNTVYPETISSVKRIDITPDGNSDDMNVVVSGSGDYFFVESSASIFLIESFLPSVVTIVSSRENDGELEFEVNTWKISDGIADAASPEYAYETMQNINKLFENIQDIAEEGKQLQGEDLEDFTIFTSMLQTIIEIVTDNATFGYPKTVSRDDIPLIPSAFGDDPDDVTGQIGHALEDGILDTITDDIDDDEEDDNY